MGAGQWPSSEVNVAIAISVGQRIAIWRVGQCTPREDVHITANAIQRYLHGLGITRQAHSAHQAISALILCWQRQFLWKALVTRLSEGIAPQKALAPSSTIFAIGLPILRARADARYSLSKKDLQFCQLGTARGPVGLI